MKNSDKSVPDPGTSNGMKLKISLSLLAVAALTGLAGCGGSKASKASDNFFTSGSREADQQASQKMAESEQLTGSGEGGSEKDVTKVAVTNSGPAGATGATNTIKALKAENKITLYDRLGGEPGISNIVADFTLRVRQDPRVNWGREGVTHGGWSFHRDEPVTWKDTPENVAKLQQHLAEFIALATGGPPHYTGKDIQEAHAGMHISNPEFDAVIGDLKVSLDRFQVPNLEQKELLAIVESTRPQIVTQR